MSRLVAVLLGTLSFLSLSPLCGTLYMVWLGFGACEVNMPWLSKTKTACFLAFHAKNGHTVLLTVIVVPAPVPRPFVFAWAAYSYGLHDSTSSFLHDLHNLHALSLL